MKQRRWLWPAPILLGLLVACSSELAPAAPTPASLAPTPVFVTVTASEDADESVLETLEDDRASAEIATLFPTAVSTLTATAPPTPVGAGIRPAEAVQQFVASEDVVDESLRPPPMTAPLALHPDDHYLFERPIPSLYRNYPLEWYPYGNNVLRADIAPYRIHHGVDFPNEEGTPVLAAGSGTVIYAGALPSPNSGVDYYGNTVIIQHDWQWQGQDVFTLYAHTLELFVSEGDMVEAGQVIAGVGSSGEVSASHLHLEIRVGENGYAMTRNPALWLVPFEGWGTLAGRFIDKDGQPITGANLTLDPLSVTPPPNGFVPSRTGRTYEPATVRSDDLWRENFVIGDLPSGLYRLVLKVGDVAYQREVTIYSGRTSFELIGADIAFRPTATPPPTATPEPTATLDSADPSTP